MKKPSSAIVVIGLAALLFVSGSLYLQQIALLTSQISGDTLLLSSQMSQMHSINLTTIQSP